MRNILLIAAALLSASAGVEARGAAAFDSQMAVILEGEQSLTLQRQCSRAKPGPVIRTWRPSEAQIAEVEAGLYPLLSARLSMGRGNNGRRRAVASDYYRQYAGFVIGSRRVIYINGFHREIVESDARLKQQYPSYSPRDWKRAPVAVCDGGIDFFGVEYDVNAKKFQSFEFNGVA
jgi:hypothetical protein